MRHVYKLQVVPAEVACSGEKMKIEDVPMFWDILVPAPNGSGINPDFVIMLAQYLSVSDEEVRAEAERLPEIEKEAIRRLSSVLDAAPPSRSHLSR